MVSPAQIAQGRRKSESRFTETLTFYVSNGTSTDPVTLQDVESVTDLYVGVPGKMKYSTLTVSESSALGQVIAAQSVVASVAVGATPNVRTDHFCRVVTSTADAGLVGRKYRVAGSAKGGQVTEHRYPVEESS